jgi:hypothetical protein
LWTETVGFCPQLTQLDAWEDFIGLSHRESFKSYTNNVKTTAKLWYWTSA